MKIPKVSYQIDPFFSLRFALYLHEKFLSISLLVYQLDFQYISFPFNVKPQESKGEVVVVERLLKLYTHPLFTPPNDSFLFFQKIPQQFSTI